MNLAPNINSSISSREVNEVSAVTDWLRTSAAVSRDSSTITNRLETESRLLNDRVYRLEEENGGLRNRILQLEERLTNTEAQLNWQRDITANLEVMIRTLQTELETLRESGR